VESFMEAFRERSGLDYESAFRRGPVGEARIRRGPRRR